LHNLYPHAWLHSSAEQHGMLFVEPLAQQLRA